MGINVINIERCFNLALCDPLFPSVKRLIVIDTKTPRNLSRLRQSALLFKKSFNLFWSGT